ncbi:bifunctional precorrin-2 dehydrogenase/sirohydrochlorin ferrochelatase [Ruminococcus sp.]|uniref:precorrin-2 dehydrogenase/sirohydrochlorin ferrochelatase family protein n=1 Tax=Ruminococcus sp. TaxID=41978 RepID=UPI0025F4657A|nr:bifunctional precorrin-2 dehydrogenase/sirohydrochlorin ferrochelatase [Ruminococcus sp.]
MPYFPFFVNIENSPCLVVGGGVVALRKIEKLLPFKPLITVTATTAAEEIKAFAAKGLVNLEERPFCDDDIAGKAFVIAATGDEGLNSRISELCKAHNILCNVVDSPENCTFYFPALVNKGDACIGISTAGKSPTLAGFLRKTIEDDIPVNTAQICDIMGGLRDIVLENIQTEKARKEFMANALQLCLELDDTALEKLSPEQLFDIIMISSEYSGNGVE